MFSAFPDVILVSHSLYMQATSHLTYTDLFYIFIYIFFDRAVTQDSRTRQTNLCTAWIDYKKANDTMPHTWLLKCLELSSSSNRTLRVFIKNSVCSVEDKSGGLLEANCNQVWDILRRWPLQVSVSCHLQLLFHSCKLIAMASPFSPTISCFLATPLSCLVIMINVINVVCFLLLRRGSSNWLALQHQS